MLLTQIVSYDTSVKNIKNSCIIFFFEIQVLIKSGIR